MSSDADKVFDLVASKLRKKKGLCPPTPEEAAEAFKKTEAIPVTDDEHEAIVNAMLSTKMSAPAAQRSELLPSKPVDQEIDAEARAIFRHPGERDEETERLEATMDEELLEGDNDEV